MGDYPRISVHQALGAGPVADVLLWRRWRGGVVVLVASTALWSLFDRAGYNLLSFASHVLLLLVCILFFWAKSASLLNRWVYIGWLIFLHTVTYLYGDITLCYFVRPLPPLPDLEISEDFVLGAADVTRVWINRASSVAHDIAVGRNLKLFVQIAVVLWIISYIGGFFNFITLVYIGILLSLSVPVLYEKYQDLVDQKLIVAHKIIQIQYQNLDDNFLRKIPMPRNKEKKSK
ncbi:hypothetical protein RHGRI_032628 [Rhododendron griersonianum]|uniref:Reticulon-like protein n=1 Tax=Rhododendron griersonianum TaxID=479676 RepID=A0AAV6IIB5_9ERIC|nr:hypothetical protein RHGRI_032628 [Rhododendron griersonianum]